MVKRSSTQSGSSLLCGSGWRVCLNFLQVDNRSCTCHPARWLKVSVDCYSTCFLACWTPSVLDLLADVPTARFPPPSLNHPFARVTYLFIRHHFPHRPFVAARLSPLFHSHKADRQGYHYYPIEEKHCTWKGWSGPRHWSCKIYQYDLTF